MPIMRNFRGKVEELEAIMAMMPTFTDAQVAYLEDLFPARCKEPLEGIEEHMLYAGKVELIAFLRSRTPSGDPAGRTEEQSEDAMVADLEARAMEQLTTNTPLEET